MDDGSPKRRRDSYHAFIIEPMKRPRVPVASLWRKAVMEVPASKLDVVTQQPPRKDERDALGEHIAKILNRNPGFGLLDLDNEVRVQPIQEQEDEPFRPLFSHRNLHRFCKKFKTFRPSKQTAKELARQVSELFQFFVKDRNSVLIAIWAFLWISVFASLLLGLACKAIVLWCTDVIMMASTLASLLLVDINEFKAISPRWLVYLVDRFSAILQWCDDVLLFGRQYAGRDWNAKRHLTGSQDAPSRHLSLLKCPPPKTPNGRWSRRTRTHVSAINFTYSMLKQHDERLARKKRCHQRSASINVLNETSSTVVCADESSSKRTGTLRSRQMSLGDDKGIWTSIEQAIGTSEIEGRNGTPRSLEQSHHQRVTSDGSSTIRRSFSDSDLFSVHDSNDDESLNSEKNDSIGAKSQDGEDMLLLSYGSENADDIGWAEVGARIGMRILSSEHVQRAVASQDTAERILDISKKVEKKFGTPKSANSEARRSSFHSGNAIFDRDDLTCDNSVVLETRSLIMPIRPVHSLWTSASAVVPASRESSASETEDNSEFSLQHAPTFRRVNSIRDGILPPRSPSSCRKSAFRRQGSAGMSSRAVSFNSMKLSLEFEKESCSSAIKVIVDGDEESVNSRYQAVDVVGQDIGMEVFLTNENGDQREHIRPAFTKPSSPLRVESPPQKVYPKRVLLQTGVKIVVPMFSIQPNVRRLPMNGSGRFFQMATVVSSKRIYLRALTFSTKIERQHTNCLSISVNLDKSFLRDGAFAQMTLRIMDAWNDRYMPRHSKYPIGTCVATSYGLGILVGWRVEDDCHIVRALWQRSGPGSANAYLNRHALHSIVEATIGFPVDTKLGKGIVLSYVNAGPQFRNGRYFVQINEIGRHKGQVLEFNRRDILACHGPEFVPIIELIREAAEYQIQVDRYEYVLQHEIFGKQRMEINWLRFSKGFEIIWSSFLTAVDDEEGFDAGVNQFFSSVISFLDQLEKPVPAQESSNTPSESGVLTEFPAEGFDDDNSMANSISIEKPPPFAWLVNDLFGGIFGQKTSLEEQEEEEVDAAVTKRLWNQQQYDYAYAVIRALMRTTTLARAECQEMPELKLCLSIVYEFLLFVRTVIKIQQKNVSVASLAVWERAIDETFTTFGPVKVRLEKIGRGIAERMRKHGNKAKIRLIRLVDILVSDETLLLALERGEWNICLEQVEQALVLAGILNEGSRMSYHKTIKFILNHYAPITETGSAASRNKEKMIQFVKVLKWLASPRLSLLKLIRHDVTLEILQRIFDRVFRNDPAASLMIFIHASNMTTIRHLRMLKDFTISGKLWIPMVEAADEEFSCTVMKMPEKSKRIMLPLSRLFSLGVAQFHKIAGGDLTADWMDFLMEDEAIRLIHQIDVELILQVESFSKDVKEVMVVLPFFPSIDDDILNLVDEFDINKFVHEASAAMADPDQLSKFIRDKSAIAIQRFLDYLPKMSIPVEQRQLGENWVITCRSESGGDLKLSDVCIKRENLVCRVMGGETTVIPLSPRKDHERGDEVEIVLKDGDSAHTLVDEEGSIIGEIRALLVNAQNYGCWQPGIGGVDQLTTDPYAASVLKGVPVSAVLNAGIELWCNLEIDDDELLEIAIKDVSFQIQLNQQPEEGMVSRAPVALTVGDSLLKKSPLPPAASPRRRFNPRVDPTLLYLKIKKFSVTLDKFYFRIEKAKKTIIDPVFEGWGRLCVENVSITIQVECRKEKTVKMGNAVEIPVLQCRELNVSLENVILEVSDTGADWILNHAVKQFCKDLTKVVESNLQDQVHQQVHTALESLNSYLQINPDIFLNILAITIDDLDENVVWV